MRARHLNAVLAGLLGATMVITLEPAKSAELKVLWSLKNVFEMPESAAFDFERQAIYISNVNDYARDGNGYISRISVDGSDVELNWVTGLNSPTGLAVFERTLFLADFDALVVIDIERGEVRARFPAPDATKTPSLNDVAIAPDGTVYVSGSRSRTIYRWQGEALEAWIQDDFLLENANGLWVEGEYLIHGGLRWSKFDLQTGKPVTATIQPDRSLVDFDGIVSDGQGGYYVTLIDDARIWHIRADGVSRPLSEEKFGGIDLDFDSETGRIALPRVGGSLSVVKVIADQ